MNSSCDLPGLARTTPGTSFPDPTRDRATESKGAPAHAVLAGGCFWCTEAVFRQLDGVLAVESGYSGGTAETANYEAVCSGLTDHAEVIRISYDPRRISYGQLLKVFFSAAHDPTQLNRQGNDRGRQYRSAIFPATAEERVVAQAYIAQLDAARVFAAPIVTTIEPLETFHLAEAYHQDFAARNPAQPYIAAVSMPKVEKLRKLYPEKLKP
jgi:peptide-methionine (S)-S-oxide reductase